MKTKTLARSHSFYRFDSACPCQIQVEQGEHFYVETFDARCGRLQRREQLLTTAPDWSSSQPQTNPCTGPVEIRGIQAGDTVKIDVHGIDLEQRGFIIHKTETGICKQLVDQTYVVFVEIEEDRAVLETGTAIPIRPHIGTLGLAPKESIATAFAGAHGGNMDCRFLEPGSSVYLPAAVDGASLGVGDVHASMGCGELQGTGIEICAAVELSGRRAEGIQVRGPVVCSGGRVMTIGSADDLQTALEIASADMVDLLERYGGYDRSSALCLLTTICDGGICQSFDHAIFSVASVSIERSYLPMFYGAESEV